MLSINIFLFILKLVKYAKKVYFDEFNTFNSYFKSGQHHWIVKEVLINYKLYYI